MRRYHFWHYFDWRGIFLGHGAMIEIQYILDKLALLGKQLENHIIYCVLGMHVVYVHWVHLAYSMCPILSLNHN